MSIRSSVINQNRRNISFVLIFLVVGLLQSVVSSLAHCADYLGANIENLEVPTLAWKLGVNGSRPTVISVKSGSVADNIGFQERDVILKVDDKPISSYSDFLRQADQSSSVTVLRNFKWVTLTLGLEAIKPIIESSARPTLSSLPPTQPILRIETGIHNAAITGIDVDRSGSLLVSASVDKTVRVWDTSSGNLGRIIRPPIGLIVRGSISALSIAPSGDAIAAGVLEKDGEDSLMFFSRQDGRLLKRIDDLSSHIVSLKFSPDGRLLTVMLLEGGLRIYFIDNNYSIRLIAKDSDYFSDDRALGSIIFSKDGNKFVTINSDDYIRLYTTNDIDLTVSAPKLIHPKKKRQFTLIKCAKFSPDGEKIAVGSLSSTKIDLISGSDLSTKYIPDTSGLDINDTKFLNYITDVEWSSSGKHLYAIGSFDKLRRWEDGGRGKYSDISLIANQLVQLHNNRIAFQNERSIGIINKDNNKYVMDITKAELVENFTFGSQIHISQNGQNIFYKELHEEDQIFYNGTYIKPALENITEPSFIFSITDRNFIYDKNAQFYSPDFKSERIQIDGRIQSSGILINLLQNEFVFQFTVSPDKQSFLLGSQWHLRRVNTLGNEIWQRRIANKIHTVNISPNGRVAVAAYADGTIRWYRYSDGKELLAFFPHADKKRWVLWTPEGFFDHSPGGEELIGWHLNQGKDKEALFFPASKLYKEFYRPDLVTASFEGKDISAFAKAIDINKILATTNLPPTVRFTTKTTTSDKPDINLSGEICDAGGGVGDVTVYLDGMPVSVESIGRGLKIVGKAGEGCQSFEKLITLQNGENVISLMAYNKNNTIESNRDSLTITHKDKTVRKPTLHVLTVAVNNYRDGDLQLKYSIPDATALSKLVQEKTCGLFNKVEIHTLFDGNVTKEKLRDKFADVGKTTRREDVFLLFVAGHGITNRQDGAYYFLPYDFRYTDETSVMKLGVSEDDLKRYLTSIQATKSLLLLDTCNSGSFAEAVASRGMIEKTAVNKLVRAVGRATIVASSKDQVALEGYEGHGVFTWTAMEGIKGKAAGSNGQITVNSLATFIEETLPKVTYKKWGYEQIPQKSLMGMDFQIGVR